MVKTGWSYVHFARRSTACDGQTDGRTRRCAGTLCLCTARLILHWLDLPRRVSYKLCLTVYKCLHGMAPQYLAELCRPFSDIQERRHLRSAALGLLDKPGYELETYGRLAFSYAGPSAWNSLPAHLRSQNVTMNNFRHSLKTFLFLQMIHAAH